MNNTLILDNTTIKTDSAGRYCLNDLHKAAGGEPKHRPGEWLKTGPTSQLITEIENANIIAVSTGGAARPEEEQYTS